ncbi:MAG: hypothetical protein HY006_04560, partial [Candidatus Sungbacteria bacterium]|nr:hypothetical protein [Candidatus Sungbacteria bacterium]
KPVETVIELKKSEVDALIVSDADIKSTNLATLFNGMNIGHWQENIGESGEWVAEPTVSRAMVKGAAASSTFNYETFSTFVTNVSANKDYYFDYDVQYKTMATAMSIRGTINPGLSDETAPYVNNGNSIAKPTVASTVSSVTLDWTALTETCSSGAVCLEPSGGSGMLEYNVYRSDTPFTGYTVTATADPATVSGITQVNASQIAAGTKTFTDTSVGANKLYYYAITAVDKKGNGDQWQYLSSGASVVTPAGGTSGGSSGGGGATLYASPTPTPTSTPAPALTPAPTAAPTVPAVVSKVDLKGGTLKEGDLIRGPDGIKVYIINAFGYKRHVFNPAVFKMYKHFAWGGVKSVSKQVADSYITSDIYRADTDHKV